MFRVVANIGGVLIFIAIVLAIGLARTWISRSLSRK